MNSEEKYALLLKELATLLESKNSLIAVQQYQIEDLKKRLEDAEHLLQNKPKYETR